MVINMINFINYVTVILSFWLRIGANCAGKVFLADLAKYVPHIFMDYYFENMTLLHPGWKRQ